MLSIGYPADRPLAPIRTPKRRPFDEVVHSDRWATVAASGLRLHGGSRTGATHCLRRLSALPRGLPMHSVSLNSSGSEAVRAAHRDRPDIYTGVPPEL